MYSHVFSAGLRGMEANTNLMFSRTALPALTGPVHKGRTTLACAVCGGGSETPAPTVSVDGGKIEADFGDKKIVIEL